MDRLSSLKWILCLPLIITPLVTGQRHSPPILRTQPEAASEADHISLDTNNYSEFLLECIGDHPIFWSYPKGSKILDSLSFAS